MVPSSSRGTGCARGIDHVFINHADVLMDVLVASAPTSGILRVATTSSRWKGLLVREAIRLQGVPHMSSPPRTVPGGTTLEHSMMLWTYADIAPGLVLNRPTSMLLEHVQAAAVGGDSPGHVRERSSRRASMPFGSSRAHDRLVYKSISGQRSVVRRLPPADRRTPRGRTSAGLDPIPGVRGRNRVPRARRWHRGLRRKTHPRGPIIATDLLSTSPPRCLTRSPWPVCSWRTSLGLTLAGIDLKRSERSGWYCFEANRHPRTRVSRRSNRAAHQPFNRAIAAASGESG